MGYILHGKITIFPIEIGKRVYLKMERAGVSCSGTYIHVPVTTVFISFMSFPSDFLHSRICRCYPDVLTNGTRLSYQAHFYHIDETAAPYEVKTFFYVLWINCLYALQCCKKKHVCFIIQTRRYFIPPEWTFEGIKSPLLSFCDIVVYFHRPVSMYTARKYFVANGRVD